MKRAIVIDLAEDSESEVMELGMAPCVRAWASTQPRRVKKKLAPSAPSSPPSCATPWCLSRVCSRADLCELCLDIGAVEVSKPVERPSCSVNWCHAEALSGGMCGLCEEQEERNRVAKARGICLRPADFTCMYGTCNALAADQKWYCAEHQLLREGFEFNK